MTRKCCYPTPDWHPIICLVPIIPCLESHPMSGTPSLVRNPISCLEPHPLVWNPISCLEPHPQVWNSIPCLEPHPWLEPHPQSGTPSLVWYLTPVLPPYPQCLYPTILPLVPLPPSGPYCPCLAPNCSLPTWSGPRLPPSGTPTLYHPPPAPTPPPLYQISSPIVPPPKKEIWVFPSFLMFVSILPRVGSISPRLK